MEKFMTSKKIIIALYVSLALLVFSGCLYDYENTPEGVVRKWCHACQTANVNKYKETLSAKILADSDLNAEGFAAISKIFYKDFNLVKVFVLERKTPKSCIVQVVFKTDNEIHKTNVPVVLEKGKWKVNER